jgi:tetratricopeptide (TPR) repeat protein
VDATIADQVAELIGLAAGLLESGKAEEAESILTGLRQIQPDGAEIHRQLGIVRATRGDYAGAVDPLVQAVRLGADDALTFNVLSVCCFETGAFEDALGCADQALARKPAFAEALNSRGNALGRLGRPAEALKAFQAGLVVTPRDPDLQVNAANAWRDLGRPADALKALDRAIALAPRLAVAHTNRGDVLQNLGRHEAAVASYDRALALAPDSVDAHWNRSLCNLRLGRFADGWREYEWRWRRAGPETRPRNLALPLWLGQESLAGRSILLHCEQGLGDSVQFARFVPVLAAMGATVILEAYPPLANLFAALDGLAQLVVRGQPLPPADFQCPLMSLPLALGGQAGAPANFAPYLRPSAEKLALWGARLAPAAGPRVGLVCSGSPTHRGDAARSLPLAALAEALGPGAQYHLLQKDLKAEDRAFAEARDDIAVWDDRIDDFADTAALCQLMDLVISVDTSVAHLAGALGKPAWILLPHNPDWRWGLNTGLTPWYPSATLYRQAKPGDWSGVLAALQAQLGALAAQAA